MSLSVQLQSELANLRPLLDESYRDYPDEQLWAEFVEEWGELKAKDIVGFLGRIPWGSVLAGALSGGTAGAGIGTTITPGYGTAIGAALGALAGGVGGALGGGGTPPPTPNRRPPLARPRPARPRPVPRQRPPAAATSANGSTTPSVGATVAAIASDPATVNAATSLIGSILNPAVIQSLGSTIMGVFGKKEIAVGDSGETVPRSALVEMLAVLTEGAASELADTDTDEWTDETVAELRLPTREERASELHRRLSAWNTESTKPAVEAASTDVPVTPRVPSSPRVERGEEAVDLREKVIRRLDGDRSAVNRFRAGVADTKTFPFSAICQLRITMPRGTGIGTGFFITPDTLLTAAHNIVHPTYGSASQITVRVARNGSFDLGSTTVRPDKMRVHPGWARTRMRSADFDLALIKVGIRPRGDAHFVMRALDFNPLSGILVAGYAADRSSGVDPDQMNVDRDSIRELTADSFDYSLHTTGGTSGSPVYYEDHGVAFAVGVHSRGAGAKHNRGCRLTENKIRWIQSAFESSLVPEYGERAALHELEELGAFPS